MRRLAAAVALATSGCAYYTITPDTSVQLAATERLAAQDATVAERVLLTCDQFLVRGSPAHALCVMRGIDQYTGETRYRAVAPTVAPGIYKSVGPYCYYNHSPYACSAMPR